MGLTTGKNATGILLTSISVNVPVAVSVPSVVLSVPPASVTVPVVVPEITAPSFAPLIVTVTTCAVPSTDVTVIVSVRVCPPFNACTVALLLLSV